MGLVLAAGLLMAPALQAQPVFYVANYGDNTISQVTMSGSSSTYLSGGYINRPFGLATDGTHLAVSNLVSGSAGSAYVSVFGGGDFSVQLGLNTPRGVAYDSNGGLYIADGDAHLVYLDDAFGLHTYTGLISNPYAMVMDAQNNLYLSSPSQKMIIKITPGQYPVPAENLSVYAQDDLINFATGMAFGSDGSLYVASQGNQSILKIAPGGGDGSVSQFYTSGDSFPIGIALDEQDNVYFTDVQNNQIIKVTQGGEASVFATGFSQPAGLLFVVPEPGTLALVALSGVFFLRRRGKGAF